MGVFVAPGRRIHRFEGERGLLQAARASPGFVRGTRLGISSYPMSEALVLTDRACSNVRSPMQISGVIIAFVQASTNKAEHRYCYHRPPIKTGKDKRCLLRTLCRDRLILRERNAP